MTPTQGLGAGRERLRRAGPRAESGCQGPGKVSSPGHCGLGRQRPSMRTFCIQAPC